MPIESTLQKFLDEGLITEVLYPLRGGKEAQVYVCAAHPSTDHELLAAKVYTPRAERGFQNDAVYRNGRVPLKQGGGIDRRAQRATKNKSRRGREILTASWVDFEYNVMRALHTAGADVPKPFSHSGDAVLMEYVGDADEVAQRLEAVKFEPAEAAVVFRRIMRNVECFLANHFVHGDLSEYNILFWQGSPVIIDFPQTVDARSNTNASMLLTRDIATVCRFFARFGVKADADHWARDLWARYLRGQLSR